MKSIFQITWTINLLLTSVTGCGAPSAEPSTTLLNGEWRFVEMKEGDEQAASDELKEMRWSIDGNTIHASEYGVVGTFNFKIDETSTPMEFDVGPIEGSPEQVAHLGICNLQGDRLQICSCPKRRPSLFSTTDGCSLMTLERIAR